MLPLGLTLGLVSRRPSGPVSGDGSTCPLATLIACDADVPVSLAAAEGRWLVAVRPSANVLVSATLNVTDGDIAKTRWMGASCDSKSSQSWLTAYYWNPGEYVFVYLENLTGGISEGVVRLVTESADPPADEGLTTMDLLTVFGIAAVALLGAF